MTESTTSTDVFNEIHRAPALIMEAGAVHELRIPKAGREGTISGYFDDPSKLAEAATELDSIGRYAGIYMTLNPCNPALLARCSNRVQHNATVTTSDRDILKRRWVLVDCDPRRPAGISSTKQEHGRAITTAMGVWDDLRGTLGDPVVADSGNGCHLLYSIDFPNDLRSTGIIKELLERIANTSAPEDVDIDRSVFNAARICKIYGTMAQKGDSLEDRPHRRSCILEIPAVFNQLQSGRVEVIQ